LVAEGLAHPFIPNPGPRTEAYLSKADILLYGGAAGGGKTVLLVGCAANDYQRSLIVRREAVQLDGIINFPQELLSGQGRFAGGSSNLQASNSRTFGGSMLVMLATLWALMKLVSSPENRCSHSLAVGTDIQIEAKEDIKKRVGSSPDEAD